MILWMLVLVLLASLAIIGYYQGAVRVGFSLVGLLLAAGLALPVGGLLKSILPAFGLKHPVLLAFLAPAIVYILILAIFKCAGLAVHRTADNYYKYKASDTKRRLWERINQRVGICLGLVNATVYILLIAAVAYVLGYFTVQVASAQGNSFWFRTVNGLNESMKTARLDKAVAPWIPASEAYYDAADILGDIYNNPLLQSRLSSYPPFLTLAERTEFKAIAQDPGFQETWQKGMTVGEMMAHEKVKPLVRNTALYNEIMGLLGSDLKDLKDYLATGKSAKFDPETILGRWRFSFKETMAYARRNKPVMSTAEVRFIRRKLAPLANAELVATIQQRAILKLASTNDVVLPPIEGTWEKAGDKYRIGLDASQQVEAVVEGDKLRFSRDGLAVVFLK